MMQTDKQQNKRKLFFLGEKSSALRVLTIIVIAMTSLSLAALSQATSNKTNRNISNQIRNESRDKAVRQSASADSQLTSPLIDYHTHIHSVNASALVTDPLLPVVEVPEELNRLLRDKERYGGRNKNSSALADLYTKDLLVLNPLAPNFIRGERALRYIINSTEIGRLLPTAYEVNGSAGYIAGYETAAQGNQYVSIFHYVITKSSDGKWRISSEVFTADPPIGPKELSADQLVKDLDVAGIKRGVVLSVAYWFGSVFRKPPEDEYAKVRAENDWTIEQVSRFPARLVAVCSFNPLKDYALDELNRCADKPQVKGIKLHFGNSGVDVLNPAHVEKMRQVFRAANDKRLAIVAHLWTPGSYGREHAEAFLNQILPASPDVTVQIAHMAGGGRSTDAALAVYADAIAAGDRRTKNLFFDVTTLTEGQSDEGLKKDAMRMRQIGLKRILYGTDLPAPPNPPAVQAWAIFRKRMPLTEDEFRTIAGNIAPYMR